MYGDLSHDERKAQTVVRDSQSTIRDPFDYIRDREKAIGVVEDDRSDGLAGL